MGVQDYFELIVLLYLPVPIKCFSQGFFMVSLNVHDTISMKLIFAISSDLFRHSDVMWLTLGYKMKCKVLLSIW